MAKAKYCCFNCPSNDWSVKDAHDGCPTCGQMYGFPLEQPPAQIGKYNVLQPIARGFYGAAYSVTHGRLKAKAVVKITPVSLYQFFKKDFDKESRLHADLAEGSEHVVGIRDTGEEDVQFANGGTIRCHVVELEYLNGCLLQEYLDGTTPANAQSVAQIAVDLLRMRQEFVQKRLYHNDLHAENIFVERLPSTMRRHGAISDSIRAKAIDLGSIDDDSKTGLHDRLGDLHSIGLHLHALVGTLLKTPTSVEDRDYRVGLALESVAQALIASPEHSRLPDTADLVQQIHSVYLQATQPWRPWLVPFALNRFGEHYNAQTLNSWNVPALLVDPDGDWLREVSKSGPQIIIGMRGCGKTLLLRALDFHARAMSRSEGEPATETLNRLRSDRYVGLFVPAQRLLEVKEQSLTTTEHRIATLTIYFSLQAVRALLHLSVLSADAIVDGAHCILEEGIFAFFTNADAYKNSSSLVDLEHRLERLAVTISRNDEKVAIASAPAQVFSRLAEVVRRCSNLWSDSQVFFLLDDVSTRYLPIEKLEPLFSVLLFSNPICAFKFTSERQTLDLGLRSPGRVNPLQIDRDVSVFDLGSVVHTTIKRRGRNHGKHFVERILEQRAAYFPGHSTSIKPSALLGDVTLEAIASDIAQSGESSNIRKRVYRGLTCLANVCVGDLGDVIKIYEEMLKASDGRRIPIPDDVQSQCFQDISSLRLYDLNRRPVHLMKHAKAFAEAGYDLLIRSQREIVQAKESRLRQYSSVYVRVGDSSLEDSQSDLRQGKQIDALRELIDAGVFVFSGGNPRTKTKDSDPIHQFKLTYRKIYGLAKFVGLADRDRFELSGIDLEEWLNSADNAKAILLRNQKGDIEDFEEALPELEDEIREEHADQATAAVIVVNRQDEMNFEEYGEDPPTAVQELPGLPLKVQVDVLSPEQVRNRSFACAIIALGFEDRALAASDALIQLTTPTRVYGVEYEQKGLAKEIEALWLAVGRKVEKLKYGELTYKAPHLPANSIIDISGLAKPAIFHIVKQQIATYGRATICHMAASQYYPLDADLESLFNAQIGDNKPEMLAQLGEVLKGESGPYRVIRLLETDEDALRRRMLLGYVFPKHERIFELLQLREYDALELVCGDGTDARARVSQLAGDVLAKTYERATLVRLKSNDLSSLIRHADESYRALYGLAGAVFEVALTGSKLQAVAAAVLSAQRRVSQAWYVSPRVFDEKRFSKGVGEIKFYDISAERGA